jgi:hypothetical protein
MRALQSGCGVFALAVEIGRNRFDMSNLCSYRWEDDRGWLPSSNSSPAVDLFVTRLATVQRVLLRLDELA